MESDRNVQIEVVLTLNEDEATWLKNILQNPIWLDNDDEEYPEDRKMRELFWSHLDGQLEQ